MKKYIIGFIAGAVFATAGAVYADDVVLIGKKIEGQTTVYKDGVRLDSAIIVDGKSYAPTRAIGEAAGYEVSFDEGEIHLNTSESDNAEGDSSNETIDVAQGGEIVVETPMTAEQLKRKMDDVVVNLTVEKHKLTHGSEAQKAEAQERIPVLEAKLAALEAEKAALEADNG